MKILQETMELDEKIIEQNKESQGFRNAPARPSCFNCENRKTHRFSIQGNVYLDDFCCLGGMPRFRISPTENPSNFICKHHPRWGKPWPAPEAAGSK